MQYNDVENFRISIDELEKYLVKINYTDLGNMEYLSKEEFRPILNRLRQTSNKLWDEINKLEINIMGKKK